MRGWTAVYGYSKVESYSVNLVYREWLRVTRRV